MIKLYAAACYLAFVAAMIYLIAFVDDLDVVPKTIDRGGSASVPWLVDLALLALFALQHSGMARRAFKRRWVSPTIERSTYVLASSACLAALYALWRPLPQIIWHVPALLYVSLAGFAICGAATFMLDHVELFGLRQPRGDSFRTPMFYKLVRHPIYVGFIVAFCAAPTMTYGHALSAATMVSYIAVAIRFEERDLVDALGDDYRNYQTRVRALVPLPRRATVSK